MPFADLALAQRLERAEGYACTQFAAARSRIFPDCGSTWRECAGALLTFDGVDGPTTQTFGLGLFEELTATALAGAEAFFFERGTAAVHEICPLVGPVRLQLLCDSGYRPVEVSNVLFRVIEKPGMPPPDGPRARIIGREEADIWTDVSTRGWTHEHPELAGFMRQTCHLLVSRESSPCFLAEVDGEPGAAAAMVIFNGVALLAGAATVPELRCRGLQGALLDARLRHAHEQGCDLAMMVTEAGSNSQRNAERWGFRIAYTRVKWRREVE